MRELEIYSEGLCYCSVCTILPKEKVAEAVNSEMPTGISSSWKVSEDKTFLDGEPNGRSCERDSERKHYLLEC